MCLGLPVMNFNGLKLIVLAVLTVFFIVAAGLDWIDENVAYGWVALTLGYIVGNSQVSSQTGDLRPIVSVDKEG